MPLGAPVTWLLIAVAVLGLVWVLEGVGLVAFGIFELLRQLLSGPEGRDYPHGVPRRGRRL
jgi:hypothetical protein